MVPKPSRMSHHRQHLKNTNKFVADRFAEELGATAFKCMGASNVALLELLSLYKAHADFFRIASPIPVDGKKPWELSEEDLRLLNLLYTFYEELMFSGYDMLIVQEYSDYSDKVGFQYFMSDLDLQPGACYTTTLAMPYMKLI
jgi:hypothetical protein